VRFLLPLTGLGAVKRFLVRRVERKVTGPGPQARATGRTYLWGEVKDAAGAAVTATLETPEAYAFTAVSAVAAVERVLGGGAGGIAPGAWTPARAFGPDFVAGLPGVVMGEVRR
jgi:saccharopine dehydrogenase (NAD+, L-lysine-forming)